MTEMQSEQPTLDVSYNAEGEIWLASYSVLPKIRGTGDTKQEAIDDLRSREQESYLEGGIVCTTLGGWYIARQVPWLDGKIGVAKLIGPAVKTLICGSDLNDVGFKYSKNFWYCTVGDRFSVINADIRKAYESARELHAYFNDRASFKDIRFSVQSGQSVVTASTIGTYIIGVGPNLEEAAKDLRRKWIKQALDDLKDNVIDKKGAKEDIERLTKIFLENLERLV